MTNITPSSLALRDYLLANGWKLVTVDRLFTLTHDDHPRRQLVFPIDSVADQAEAIDLAIDKLADLEARSKAALLADIESLGADVVRFRLLPREETDSIPLSFAISTLVGAQAVLLASAHSVLAPQLLHKRLSRAEAKHLVEQARFGHTEPGSFVLRVECPLEPQMVSPGEVPFTRMTTLSLMKGISQLAEAIEQARVETLIHQLQESSRPSLSANLCEGLGQLFSPELDNSVEVSVRWSPLVPVPPSTQSRVRLQPSYFRKVEEIRDALKPREGEREESYIGTVEELSGEMGNDGRRSGAVELSLLLPENNQTVRARVQLDAEQYFHALEAHGQQGVYVQVKGRLRGGRQPRDLVDLTSFSIVPPIKAT